MGQSASISIRQRPELQDSTCGFHRLSIDILYCIVDLEEVEDVVCLVLTCKSLFNKLFQKAIRQLEAHPHTPLKLHVLLVRLERDVGHRWYFYYWCTKLHRFRPYRREDSELWKRVAWPDNPYACREKLASKFGWTPPPGGLLIQYYHLRLVMNHHFYGVGKGLPTIALAKSTSNALERHPNLR